jgi:3-dehydroquinate dehydratase-2
MTGFNYPVTYFARTSDIVLAIAGNWTLAVALRHTRRAVSNCPTNPRNPQMATLLVLHGPNLNLLGTREPGHYGAVTLAQINQDLEQRARAAGHHLQYLQSNAEYELIDRIHAARNEGVDFILINPAAFTHTSVALRDALLAVSIPFIEVHLSNVHKREPFRHHSYFSDVAVGVICGLGASGYRLALESALEQLAANAQPK